MWKMALLAFLLHFVHDFYCLLMLVLLVLKRKQSCPTSVRDPWRTFKRISILLRSQTHLKTPKKVKGNKESTILRSFSSINKQKWATTLCLGVVNHHQPLRLGLIKLLLSWGLPLESTLCFSPLSFGFNILMDEVGDPRPRPDQMVHRVGG